MNRFTMPKVYKLKLCGDRKIQIESEPLGDFWWMWPVMLQRQDEPNVEDVLKAAQGKWMYKPVRLRLAIDNPPADLRLSVHTHYALKGVKREYLFPDELMLPLKRDTFEWTFKAKLIDDVHYVALLTLPGDRIFLNVLAKHKFIGRLEVLFCAS